jgi:glycosyltransferase involved in cell wall biosynthesis
MNLLIWYPINELAPIGGPSGYLYNLKDELGNMEINVSFLPGSTPNIKKTGMKSYIRNKFSFLLDIVTINNILIKQTNIAINLSKYDAIHFHSTRDLYHAREIIKSYKGKIILTSHSPKPLHQEIIDDVLKINNIQKKLFNSKINKLSEVDKYAFERADYIFFPCKEAEEPYINNWEWYRDFSNEKKSKYKYIPSCINRPNVSVSKQDILEKYGIPKNSKVLCYVGRHNETKGYDTLKKIGETILKSHKDVYFLIAGKEEPLKGLSNQRWIEVGWTKDPHSIINASDIFILPNKETYFDLILLEVLSLGKPVLLSNTGGNKYFKKYKEIGFRYFNDENEAINQLKELVVLKNSDLDNLGQRNLDVFNKNFDTSNFIVEYESVLKSI